MDPNETLRKIRENLKLIDQAREVNTPAIDLAEEFEALDGWLSAGGFLPIEWERV